MYLARKRAIALSATTHDDLGVSTPQPQEFSHIAFSHLLLQQLRVIVEHRGNIGMTCPQGILEYFLRPLEQRLRFTVFALFRKWRAWVLPEFSATQEDQEPNQTTVETSH